MKKIILDLCGGTGSWSKPYAADPRYDVRLITLPDRDVRAFARDVLKRRPAAPSRVHGILAAPPCDHFSVSGAQYWPAKDADGRTADALSIVDACLDIIEFYAGDFLKFWALENPVGRLRGLRVHRMGEPRLIFDPCDFGDPYTKKTLLWGEFADLKKTPVEPVRVCAQGSWVQRLGGKSDKTKLLRSMTPQGFATAFYRANR